MRNHGKVLCLVLTVLLVALLAGCSSSTGTTRRTTATAPAPTIAKLKVVDSEQQRQQRNLHQVIVTGQVENTADRTANRVAVKVAIRGWDGEVLGTGNAVIGQIKAGKTGTFRVVINHIPEQRISHTVEVTSARF